MKVNRLINVSWNMRNTLLDSHLLSQSRPKLFLRWKCFESTGFSDNKNEPCTNCTEGPFWNLVQSSKPNRDWKWECHEENERVSCCLQCSTAGYWHSHIKRNKHFSPNLGHKRKQRRETEQRGGRWGEKNKNKKREDTDRQPGKTDKGNDNQTGGQIRPREWDSDQNTGKNK